MGKFGQSDQVNQRDLFSLPEKLDPEYFCDDSDGNMIENIEAIVHLNLRSVQILNLSNYFDRKSKITFAI